MSVNTYQTTHCNILEEKHLLNRSWLFSIGNCLQNCEIWGFHGSENDDTVLLGFLLCRLVSRWQYFGETYCLHPSTFQHHHSSPKYGDSMFLQNVIYRQVYTAPKPRRTLSSISKIVCPSLVVAGLLIVIVLQEKQMICSFYGDWIQWSFWVISHMSMELVSVLTWLVTRGDSIAKDDFLLWHVNHKAF
jgi:hypothetical protein